MKLCVSLGCLLSCLCFAGCTSGGMGHGLSADAATGEVVAALREPIVLARAAPELTSEGQDYLYLMPTEANLSGARVLYLWVGTASTIDRVIARAASPHADGIRFVFAARQIDLPLVEWQDDALPRTPLRVTRSLRSSLPLDDFEALAGASSVRVELTSGTDVIGEYLLRRGSWQRWGGLHADTAVGIGVNVSVTANK